MSKFINPYAFVRLPDKKTIEETQNGETFTGKIECSLYPRTPLFMPNTTNDKMEDHKSYDFYSYADISNQPGDQHLHEPIIPGSSIRGEVRSLYEAITGSCLSTSDSELVLYKRMPDPGDMGLLENVNGTFKLYKAEKYMACFKHCNSDSGNKIFDGSIAGPYFDKSKLTECMKVWFSSSGRNYKDRRFLPETVDEISTKSKSGLIEGFILIGEPFVRKHHFSIAVKSRTQLFTVSSREIEMFERVLDLYEDRRINRAQGHNAYKNYKEQYKKIKQHGGIIPVFYKTQPGSTTVKYISPACISKEVYQNTILELLKKSGLNPCADITELCPSCTLFGMVGQDNSTALSGRVRFSDTRMERQKGIALQDVYHEEVTLKELSSPKVSSTEFYLRPPNATGGTYTAKLGGHGADIWNYDFAFKWDGYSRGPKIKGYNPRISGRKFYWQHESFDWKSITEPRSKRNNTIRPIKPCKREAGEANPDYRFAFDVYFERLTKIELDRLIAVLHLGLDNGNTGYHSIGHGKPFGMGSAKIVIDKVLIRKLSAENGGIERSFEENTELKKSGSLLQVFGDRQYVRQVMAICAVHKFQYPIMYPVPEGGGQSYEWFVNNRVDKNKPINNPIIDKTLPEIPDDANNLSSEALAERMALEKNKNPKR